MADPGLSFAFVNFSYLPLIAFAVLTSKITSQINSLYGSLFIKEEKVKIFLISSKVMWISNSYSVAKHISRFISKVSDGLYHFGHWGEHPSLYQCTCGADYKVLSMTSMWHELKYDLKYVAGLRLPKNHPAPGFSLLRNGWLPYPWIPPSPNFCSELQTWSFIIGLGYCILSDVALLSDVRVSKQSFWLNKCVFSD